MNSKLFNFEQYPSCNMLVNQIDPTQFHFSYEKRQNECKQQLSPADTCAGTNDSKTPKQLQFCKYNQKQFQSSNSNGHELIIVNQCVEQYDKILSRYLQKSLKIQIEGKIDFLSVSQFQQLAVQNKQLSKMIEQYGKQVDLNQSILAKTIENNQSVKWFLQEITYINKQKINFQLLVMIDQILLNYNQKHIKFLQYNTQINETAQKLYQSPLLNFVNFRFINTQHQLQKDTIKQAFFKFVKDLSQIVDILILENPSYSVKQAVQIDECEKKASKLNLFSSKRDLWDSQQQDQQLQLGKCLKRVKLA